ncbi:hypothetical protein C5S31_03795, partial [ANME-1 cluster archaeon GoMg2]|nr:hypothetical protein [ANME-1 cluster archaeon GoMg2]
MKGAVIAAIILAAFVGAAFATTLTATPNQIGIGEFVITEGSEFEANVAVTPTTATIYEAVPQFKIGRINNNVAFGPSRSKFFSPETNNGAASYDVNLTVDDETKTTDVGVNAIYILTVTNTGNATDSFNLTCTNPDSASVVELNKTQVTLSASATETVSLNVTNATVGIGTFRVNVTATSHGESNKTDYINTTTTIAIYGVNLTVDNETKTTDVVENATYFLTVTNTGNADDSFNLTYTNPDIASVVVLNKSQVTLSASATETVSLNVGNATVGTFRVNVTASSLSDTSKSDFVNTTTTVDEILYGVNLTVNNETKTTDVGENATYILTVTNTGNAGDSFNLTFTNPDNASIVALNKSQVTLIPSATETVSLNVGNATVGTFRVNVTATSLNDSNKVDYVNTTTIVVPVAVYGVDLTVDGEAKTTVEGENANYILTVN